MVNTLQGQHLPFQMTFRKVISPISSKMGFNFCVRASDQQDVGEEKRPNNRDVWPSPKWNFTRRTSKFPNFSANLDRPVDGTNTEKNQRMRTVKKKPQTTRPSNSKFKKKTHAISVLFFFTDRLRGTTGTTNKRGNVAARKSTLRCRNGVTFRPPSPITKHSTETTPKRVIFFLTPEVFTLQILHHKESHFTPQGLK